MTVAELLAQIRAELGAYTDFTVVLITVALLLCRILPVLTLTPFLGGEVVPTEVKLGTSLALAAVMYPLVATRMQFIPVTPLPLVALLLKELFIGLSLSMVVGLVFDATVVAGTLIDNFSGTNQAQLMVPQLGQQVSIFSSLKVQVAGVLFLALDGHHVVLETLADSVARIPLDQFPRFGHGRWAYFETCARLFGDLFRMGVALSAPILLSTLMADLGLGIINRAAPQVQVYFISMQIKPVVAVVTVFVSLHAILQRLGDEYVVTFAWLRRVVDLLG